MLLDLVPPDVDGYEVCRRVRHNANYIPIVMLTARGELADKLVGLEIGADAYIAKPFERRELLAQIRVLLRLIDQREVENQHDSPPECGHVRLWEQQHRVEIDGEARELTPKEFELLLHFLRHPGQVFGRETLLREIWGYDFLGDSRTVDVHIQRLRARIERDSAAPRLIRTVRGFGSQLVAVDARTSHGHRS
jgi:DNA-binding response OmpR family regulator